MSDLTVTILMPCLNEAETLAFCVRQAVAALRDNNVAGEVVVADNGSTDGSQKIATDEGASRRQCAHSRLRGSTHRRD
ncbi:glycosyltransferase [Tunturiibacter empetritectus]|uniref:glycosyltransferase n=1 Tax=Tunturiibacter empetritectus TaxID=3069691 RepID=UPI003D9BE9F4